MSCIVHAFVLFNWTTFIVVYVVGLQFDENSAADSATRKKDPRCHMLRNPGCDVSLYSIMDYEEAGWFYHAPFHSCRPFFASRNTSVCAQNRDLPFSKQDCELLCGDECLLSNGDKGLCQLEHLCSINMPASHHPRPCEAYNVVCCPQEVRTSS